MLIIIRSRYTPHRRTIARTVPVRCIVAPFSIIRPCTFLTHTHRRPTRITTHHPARLVSCRHHSRPHRVNPATTSTRRHTVTIPETAAAISIRAVRVVITVYAVREVRITAIRWIHTLPNRRAHRVVRTTAEGVAETRGRTVIHTSIRR